MMLAVRTFVAFCLFVLLVPPAVMSAPRAGLVTMGPGDELFSMFGHAALCVTDSELPGGGLCYNYGTSDFSRPMGLGWDVLRGRAKFWVSVSDWITMLLQFQAQDRSIYVQWLPLDAGALERLTFALEHDARPENREYIYSHFLDNCSTRPRDLVDDVTDGELRRSTLSYDWTYRDYAREGFAASHWSLVPLGDFIMGRWVDQDIGVYEQMFIPRILRAAVERELGSVPETLYERQGPAARGDVPRARSWFWLVVFAATAVSWSSRFGAKAILVILGTAGALLWVGALGSPWPELRTNELILLFVPLDLLLVAGFVSRRYVRVRLIMSLGVLGLKAAGILVQPLWPYWALITLTLAAFWWRARKDILAR